MSLNFSGFAKFLESTANDDREFLRDGEFDKIPSTSCALANSSGGWIILGAEKDENDEINITGFKNKNINLISLIPNEISFAFQILERVMIICIAPLEWHKRPLLFKGKIYRRVEGVNLISSKKSAAIIASDLSAPSLDDEPAMNFYLNPESIEDFYNTVIKIRPEYKNFSTEDFFSRSFIFSGKFLTFAGVLMFGNIIKVRAVLDYSSKRTEITENNIWDAYKNILPRLVSKLSSRCSQAFQEIFVNALLHSNYKADNFINVSITSNPAKVLIENPGTIRRGTRNKRLEKIFEISGISKKGRSLETIKKYMPSFRLEQDMLNFRVRASLELEGLAELSNSQPIIL